jgi:uncharacterized SAM-binding protein YcdF (DUF218 family)
MFEAKTTRIYRHLASLGLVIMSLFLGYTFICSILLLDARNETKNAKTKFVQTPPDLIVVFTGGFGRIEFAIKKAREFRQPNVFITGVNEKNSVQSLLNPINISDKESEHFDLDYTAKNTVENVMSTLKYLRASTSINRVLIISSDYHIMRIKHIMETLKLPSDKFEFYYSAVPSNYLHLRNIKILYTETFKLVRTKIFLLFLNSRD